MAAITFEPRAGIPASAGAARTVRPDLRLVPDAEVRGPSPRQSAQRSTSAAVYRRRRIVATLIAVPVAVLVAVGVSVGTERAFGALGSLAGLAAPTTAGEVPATSYVVEPGDTLWDVAQRVAPGSDARPVVDALVEARGTSAVAPGETITWVGR